MGGVREKMLLLLYSMDGMYETPVGFYRFVMVVVFARACAGIKLVQ